MRQMLVMLFATAGWMTGLGKKLAYFLRKYERTTRKHVAITSIDRRNVVHAPRQRMHCKHRVSVGGDSNSTDNRINRNNTCRCVVSENHDAGSLATVGRMDRRGQTQRLPNGGRIDR